MQLNRPEASLQFARLDYYRKGNVLMSSTQDRLQKLVNEHLDLGANPDFDAQLADSGVSSVDAVAFFKEVNQTFNLSLKAEECLQFKTLRLLVNYIDANAG